MENDAIINECSACSPCNNKIALTGDCAFGFYSFLAEHLVAHLFGIMLINPYNLLASET